MPSVTRILCPVDFSENSLHAFNYADDFAAWVGADLVLLHAFDRPASYDAEGQWIPADPSIEEELRAIQSKHDNVKVTQMMHAGTAGDVICWAAEEKGCNLIVMGTHGRSGIRRALFGSAAEHVLRHARCPVLTIREQKKHDARLPEPMVAPMPAPRHL